MRFQHEVPPSTNPRTQCDLILVITVSHISPGWNSPNSAPETRLSASAFCPEKLDFCRAGFLLFGLFE
eukprot:Pgem_evm1s9437